MIYGRTGAERLLRDIDMHNRLLTKRKKESLSQEIRERTNEEYYTLFGKGERVFLNIKSDYKIDYDKAGLCKKCGNRHFPICS